MEIYGLNPVIELLRIIAASERGKTQIPPPIIKKLSVGGDQALAKLEKAVPGLNAILRKNSISIGRKRPQELEKISGSAVHQSIVATVDMKPLLSIEELLDHAQGRVIVICDNIEDPRNLGAIIRSAEALGAAGVVLPRDRASTVTPTAIKASAGAFFWLRVAQVANIAETITKIRDKGYWSYGLEADGDTAAWGKISPGESVALVVGSEGKGLRRLVRERCDFILSIPMSGKVNSLNASVASAIALSRIMELLKKEKDVSDVSGEEQKKGAEE